MATCIECGSNLLRATEGLCSRCLMAQGLKAASPLEPVSARFTGSQRNFGDYELLEEISRGGMGVVFKAHQKSLDRVVAVKTLLFGPRADPDMVKRFRAEATVAASLHHPNIVAIHEVGVYQDEHYLVMDLVDGPNLAQFVKGEPLSGLRAATYLKAIAEAIHYAHNRGILHRDLKPSNVLIDSNDQPRVTDFGLAKRLNIDSSLTLTGQVLGSPSYMPPEQATTGRGTVGRRSDVYSLGAMLYHVLTGRPPFVGQVVSETLEQVFNCDPICPRALNPAVPPDLETICLKCLEKEPARRYETAGELADELGRFLRHEPILARPIGLSDRAWRWCSRNRVSAILGSIVAMMSLAALFAIVWHFRKTADLERQRREQAEVLGRQAFASARSAEAAEKRAETEAARSSQEARFIKDMLKGVAPAVALGRDTTLLHEILDATASRIDTDLSNQPAVEAGLLATLGNVYKDIADFSKAGVLLEKALALRKQIHGQDHPGVAESLNDLGDLLYRQGKRAEAERMHRQALAIRRRIRGNDHMEVAESLANLAESMRKQSPEKLLEAEPLVRESLEMRRRLLGDAHIEVAGSFSHLGALLLTQGKYPEAEAAHRQALYIRRALQGDGSPEVASSLVWIGLSVACQDRNIEAESLHREALVILRRVCGEGHPDLTDAIQNLAKALQNQDRFPEAEALFREAFETRRKRLGREHPASISSLHFLTNILIQEGKVDDAEPLLQELLELRGKGEDIADFVAALELRVDSLRAQGKFVEAEAVARQCLDLREKQMPEDWRTFDARIVLAGVLLGQKKYADAEPLLLSGYAGMKHRQDKVPLMRFKEAIQRLVQLYEETMQTEKTGEWKQRLTEFDRPAK